MIIGNSRNGIFIIVHIFIISVVELVLVTNMSLSQTTSPADSFNLADIPVDSSKLRSVENRAFAVGERLIFSVDYGFIHAGMAMMTVENITKMHGRKCYHVTSWAFSSGAFAVFFKVRDKIDTYIDTEGIFSWRSEKHLREGRYKADRVYDLYQLHGISRNAVNGDTLTIPPFVQDALSSLYYVRTLPLEIGDFFRIPHFDNGKVYDLGIKVHKKETIKVPAGSFQTILVEPLMASEGIFKKEGRLKVWLTDDERRIPVKMTSKIAIGSIGAHLTRIETDFGIRPYISDSEE